MINQSSHNLDSVPIRSFLRCLAGVSLAMAASGQAFASDLKGPSRFCGFSPIIDLRVGESITILKSGMHGGTFRWEGKFGSLDVNGIGWASEPPGSKVKPLTAKGHVRYVQQKRDGRFAVAIWNKRNGAAYFSSDFPITRSQIDALNRVDLYDENGPEPSGCKLRTAFTWE